MGSQAFERIKAKVEELKYDVSALYLVYKRKDVPVYAKIMIVVTIAYALSPIDLIPDFIPVLGYLDDIILVPFFIYISLKLIPKEIMAECREQAKDLWQNGRPKKWYYAIPIVIIWVVVVCIVIRYIFW